MTGTVTGAADRSRLHAAARQLETLVLKELVRASKAFTGGEGAGSAIRADLFADALADTLARGGGLGLARRIEETLGGSGAGTREVLREGAPAGDPAGSSQPTVTSGFGPRHDPFDGHLTRHEGVDLGGAEGAAIRAAAGGVVRRAAARGGYGAAVEIDHGAGLSTVYAHASELLVREGETVEPGQAIARVGHTGRATGPHLHFEVRVGGVPVDPSRALRKYALRADGLVDTGS